MTQGTSLESSPAFDPTENAYDKLHGLALIWKVRPPTEPNATSWRRAFLQCIDVAIWNCADLTDGAAADIQSGDVAMAALKMEWSARFHVLLTRLTARLLRTLPMRDAPSAREHGASGLGSHQSLVEAMARLDHVCVLVWNDAPWSVLPDLGTNNGRFVHTFRLSNHRAVVWENNLLDALQREPVDDIDAWIGADSLRSAVKCEAPVAGPFLQQFRALHQIPEIAVDEVVALARAAVLQVRGGEFLGVSRHLVFAKTLVAVVADCMELLLDGLSTAQYHAFRESLGPASGMQSSGLRALFYGSEFRELENLLRAFVTNDLTVAHMAVQQALDSLKAIEGDLTRWYKDHVALTRHCLGTGPTRSMIGTPSATHAVERLTEVWIGRRTARSGIRLQGDIERQVMAPGSAYSQVGRALGEFTRGAFPEVQDRGPQR